LGGTYNYYQITWPVLIYPYVRNVQLYRCPSTSNPIANGVDYGVPYHCANNGALVSYWTLNPPLKLGQFLQPASSLMITEKSGGNPQYVLQSQYPMCARRHNDGGNCAFMDGHVKWLKFDDTQLPAPWPTRYNYGTTSEYYYHPPTWVVENVY